MSDEEYEVIDIRGSRDWINRVLGDVSRESAVKQAGVGAVSGMLAGFLFVKVGRVAAATLGSTVLILQIASHNGYIQVNWNRVRETTRQVEGELRRVTHRHYPGTWQNIRDFVQQNLIMAVSFGGGFLVGMAF